MATRDQVLEVFRRFDTAGDGCISRGQLSKVLQELDSSTWNEAAFASLMEKSGMSKEGPEDEPLRYEALVDFAMGRASGRTVTEAANGACQAAFDGDLEALRGLVQEGGAGQAGYVKVGDTVAGIFCIRGSNTAELRSLADGKLPPATPLHYAVFAGQVATARFLLEECGQCKDEEGELGASATDLAHDHCVGLDGSAVEPEGVLGLLQDEAPLEQVTLQRSITKSRSRKEDFEKGQA